VQEQELEGVVAKRLSRVTALVTDFGASWRGIVLAFTRLYKGWDPRLRQRLEDPGLSNAQVSQALDCDEPAEEDDA
jgi:hypothetical protein